MAKFPNIPGYKIEKVLGKGGMATVYLAVQENFERHVALKVMHKTLIEDESWSQRFLREARTVAKMSHQAIVPVYDVGSAGTLHYMSMEFLPGGDLKEKMRKGLTVLDSISIMKSIAKGLDYAGSKKLVHRDIKPENILFREDGSPVISDFGISRLTDSKTNITVTGSMVGTPHYMSPEQAQGIDVDPRSDLYSLGIMLYELLTGEVPFTGNSAINIGIKHISEAPKALPDELKGFQKVMDKALAKNPDERYQSGEEFCAALSLIEFSLSAQDEATVMMSSAEVRRLTNANERRVSASSISPGVGRRSGSFEQDQASGAFGGFLADPKKLFLGITGVGALVIAVLYFVVGKEGSSPDAGFDDNNVQVVLKSKADKLLDQARIAMAEKNYFGSGQNNAQYFVTTLLTINPRHTEALSMLDTLFTSYLDEAEEAISRQQAEAGDAALKRASSLAFYVKNPDLSRRLIELNNQLNVVRQQQLVSEAQQTSSETMENVESAVTAAGVPSESNETDGQRGVPETMDPLEVAVAQTAPETVIGEPSVVTTESVPEASDVLDEEGPESESAEAFREPAISEAQVERPAESLLDDAEVSALLVQAASAYERGRLSRPASDNAFSHYVAVLNARPESMEASEGLAQVFAKYESFVDRMIAARNFERAQLYYDGLEAVLARKTEIAHVTANVDALFARYSGVAGQKQQDMTQAFGELEKELNVLFSRAEGIRQKGLNDSTNAQLRLIYQQALKLSPTSSIAAKGLLATSDFEAAQVVEQLEQGNQVKALQHVAKISSTTPEYPKLAELRSTIRRAENSARQASTLLARAEGLMNFRYEKPGLFGNNKDERKKLREAYALIAEAKKVHPFEPGVPVALKKLDQKYASIMNTLLRAGDRDEAKSFGQDTRQYEWEGAQVSDLMKRI